MSYIEPRNAALHKELTYILPSSLSLSCLSSFLFSFFFPLLYTLSAFIAALSGVEGTNCICRSPCNMTRYNKELSMVKIPSKTSARYLRRSSTGQRSTSREYAPHICGKSHFPQIHQTALNSAFKRSLKYIFYVCCNFFSTFQTF